MRLYANATQRSKRVYTLISLSEWYVFIQRKQLSSEYQEHALLAREWKTLIKPLTVKPKVSNHSYKLRKENLFYKKRLGE